MIVESAERFGLSQLHQLRGRVGRGADKSYCVLITKDKISADANTRINAMVKSQDGFELAEVDLKLRGPGNLMGTQQSGVLQMIIADLTKDASILENARKAVLSLLHKDPNINSKVNSTITSTLLQLERGKGIWKYIS
jgi:ATP-dependent DNA helicase RecG